MKQFSVGTKVIIHRPKTENERSKNPEWVSEMDSEDGKIGVIIYDYVENKVDVESEDSGMIWAYHINWLETFEPFRFLTGREDD